MCTTSLTNCLCWAFVAFSSSAHAQARDTVPLDRGIRVALTDRVPIRGERVLSLLLTTEDHFPTTGYRIAAVVTRSAGLRSIDVLGVHRGDYPFFGQTVSPASFVEPLELSAGGAPDTIDIAYRQDVDRYMVWRTATHAHIRTVNASFTMLEVDSLALGGGLPQPALAGAELPAGPNRTFRIIARPDHPY